ncbi:MAG: hypothetical protein L0H41_04530 [Microlunatus sp.]|nr:hypothetical protein [Microlunatus sp.]MDN5771526.1 hypothetical protein [Microlunatus sp.]
MPESTDTGGLGLSARVVGFLSLALGLGAGAGVLWWLIVTRPAYRLDSQGRASVTERGLTQFFAGDAWYCLLGLVIGVGLGVLGWRVLRDLGWPVVLVVVIGGAAAGLLCWLVGYQLGPGEFTPRLAAATPGDAVPITLTVRSKAALLSWPLCAVTPVLFASSLGRDSEEPKPILTRSRSADDGD